MVHLVFAVAFTLLRLPSFLLLFSLFFFVVVSFTLFLSLSRRFFLSVACRGVGRRRSNMYNRRVLAGEFTVVNKYLLR